MALPPFRSTPTATRVAYSCAVTTMPFFAATDAIDAAWAAAARKVVRTRGRRRCRMRHTLNGDIPGLLAKGDGARFVPTRAIQRSGPQPVLRKIGRASCRERV